MSTPISYDLKYTDADHLWTVGPLPLFLHRPRGKPLSLSFNAFRDMRSVKARNSLKQKYAELVTASFPIKPKQPYKLPYKTLLIYYAPDKRIRDIDGMCTIVNKFTLDALVVAGLLADDNTRLIGNTHFAYGGLSHNKTSYINFHIFKDTDYAHYQSP